MRFSVLIEIGWSKAGGTGFPGNGARQRHAVGACNRHAPFMSSTHSWKNESRRPAGFPLDLYDEPGHLIRRAHQIAVAMFYEKLGRDVTPVQYAVLRMLYECPGPIR